jgi:two-component system chemotaxis response regulator CheY
MATFFIVDDEPLLQDLYLDILEMRGHEIIGYAENGNDCVNELKKPGMDPDIVIMDHRMPLRSGLEATKELLEIKPDLRIIFVSADISAEKEALELGAVGFIKKPFNIETFFKVLEKFLC